MEKTSVTDSTRSGCVRTRLALLWMNLANEPLSVVYTLLPFILIKDLGANAFQVALFITLRPCLSVFSFYWGSYLKFHKNKLVSNLISACILAYLPFIFLSFSMNIWLILLAAGAYQLFNKAGTPALIEILKRNIPKKSLEHAFSLYYMLGFIESGLLGLAIGYLLDHNAANLKLLFLFCGLAGLSSVFFQMRISVPKEEVVSPPESLNHFLHPWKESFHLLRIRPDFRQFQMTFMIGGSALMLMAPAFSVFYAETLALSHADISIARFIFMALGVMISTFHWKTYLQKLPINTFIIYVLLGFGLFSALLLLASLHLAFLYLAFFLYGIAQAGSHLIWNLSGALFGKEEDSSPYTCVNILMQGLRGMIVPFLGGILCKMCGPIPVMVFGTALCFSGAFYMKRAGATLPSPAK